MLDVTFNIQSPIQSRAPLSGASLLLRPVNFARGEKQSGTILAPIHLGVRWHQAHPNGYG